MKLQTNELKRCQKGTLIKVLRTRKVSIQVGELNLHYVPMQTWLEQSEFAEAEKKPTEVSTKQELSRLLKHFYWEIRKAKGDEFEPSFLKTIQRGLDRYLQEKNSVFSIIRQR